MSKEVKTKCTVSNLSPFLSFTHPFNREWSHITQLTVEAIRLFIVDKNSKVRQALEARLSSSSLIEVVGTARSAAEGIRRYPELKPDVMLIDARTAGRPKDIADVVAELSQQGPSVIVLTGYSTETEKEAALDSGAAKYLLKDIDSAALISEIESLGKSSLRTTEG
jgi:DNA-binding NarL/FixJ family response regulator